MNLKTTSKLKIMSQYDYNLVTTSSNHSEQLEKKKITENYPISSPIEKKTCTKKLCVLT